jgi:prepilin-type N-terminal cleavage/methylation domain-containing protein
VFFAAVFITLRKEVLMYRPSATVRGFTLVELLVVIAIIAVIAGLVVPSLMTAQGSAYKLQCTSNLRGLQQSAFTYATKKQRFPIAKEKDAPAHVSLNELLKSSAGASLEPSIFVCPEGEAFEAEVEEADDGSRSFLLDSETLSYMWILKPTRPTKKSPLSCDKYVRDFEDEDGKHQGHMNSIVLVDTSGKVVDVDTMDEDDLNKYQMSDDFVPEGLTR